MNATLRLPAAVREQAACLDASGANRFHYSLTQRVFLCFQAQPQPLNRAHLRELLGIGDWALDHALRALETKRCIQKTPGRYGYYQLAPGAYMPSDERGRHPNSRGHRKKKA